MDALQPLNSRNPEPTLSFDRPGDNLVLVRRTFGRLPRSSLVIIGLQGGVTGGHMRVDLPEPTTAVADYARRAAECIAGMDAHPPPEAVVLLLFVEEEPDVSWVEDPSARPHAALVESLSSIFEAEYGVEVPKIWIVGGSRMRDYQCLTSSCCPFPGEDTASLLADAEVRHPWLCDLGGSFGRASFEDPSVQVHRFESGGLREAEFLTAVSEHGDTLAESGRGGGAEVHDLLLHWDSALEITAEVRSADWLAVRPESAAQLLAVAKWPGLLDTLIPLAAEGFATGLCGYLGHRAAADSGEDPLRAARLLRDRYGEQIPDDLASSEDLETLLHGYRLSFLGRTGRRPDWRRMDALRDLLSALAGCAETESLTHMMALMGWIEWARGRGSCAGAFIDRCRELTPEHELAQLIEQYMALGGISPWARVKVHSWSWWHSSATANIAA